MSVIVRLIFFGVIALTGMMPVAVAESVFAIQDPSILQPKSLPRTTTDRPGANVWDVKFSYATFKDGPDSKRDTNGQISALASEMNAYFRRQRPGYELRFDTSGGRLDIQHIPLGVTVQEFDSLFTQDGRELQEFIHRTFRDAGMPISWLNPESRYGIEKRIHVMFIEGPRGIKRGAAGDVAYECGRVSEFEAGGRITGINLRDSKGEICGPFLEFTKNKSQWWSAARDAMRFLSLALRELPDCDSVMRTEIDTFYLQRPENVWSTKDIVSNKWMIPRNRKEEPVLDVARTNYFKISSGPYVGDRCRDIQYSPFWREMPQAEVIQRKPKNRSIADKPDETTEPRLKVYYVVPKDGIDRQLDLSLNPMMTTANAWLKNQTGKQLRWDTYNGNLDVMFVRLSETEAELWQSDDPTLGCWEIPCPSPRRLYGLLKSRGLVEDNEISVILYEGTQSPVQPRPSGCYAGDRYVVGYSMCLSQPYTTPLNAPSGGSLGIRIMHEVFHTLGAVGAGAPNGDYDGGHINGNTNDIMAIGTRTGWVVDPGRDDYWGHGRTDLVDISRSVFLDPRVVNAEFPRRWNENSR